MEPRGEAELIGDLAGPLPAMMIGDLLGFPHDMWPKLMDWSARTIVGGGGPSAATDDVRRGGGGVLRRVLELYQEKRGCPADDIMSVWTQRGDRR